MRVRMGVGGRVRVRRGIGVMEGLGFYARSFLAIGIHNFSE